MSKKVLLISTSLRAHSNSEVLADAFLAGAGDAGNVIEKISLKGKSLAFCKGCLSCIQTGKCVISDDAVEIAERIPAFTSGSIQYVDKHLGSFHMTEKFIP